MHNSTVRFKLKPFTDTFTKPEHDLIHRYHNFRNVIGKMRRVQIMVVLKKLELNFQLPLNIVKQIQNEANELLKRQQKNQEELDELYSKNVLGSGERVMRLKKERKTLRYYFIGDKEFAAIKKFNLKMESDVFAKVYEHASSIESLQYYFKKDFSVCVESNLEILNDDDFPEE